MKKCLIVIGCGSQGRMVKNTIHNYNVGYSFGGFLDDKFHEVKEYDNYFQAPINIYEELLKDKNNFFFVAIGNPQSRADVVQNKLSKIPDNRFATLIHPLAYVDPTAKLGYGLYISANTTLMHQVEVGNHTIINSSSIIEYETKVGEFVTIAPNVTICGAVVIENEVFIGAGSVVTQYLVIKDNSLVGANSTVIKNVEKNTVIVGVSKMLKKTNKDNGSFSK